MSFRLVPKSVTLNGVMVLFCIFSANSGSFQVHCVKVHIRYLICWWVLVSGSSQYSPCPSLLRQEGHPGHKNRATYPTWFLSRRGKRLKAFPYFIPSVGPGADPSVQAVSLQVSHPPGGRLPLLSTRPAVTSPATASTMLYCLVTDAHRCEQLAQGYYAALPQVGFEPATYWSQVQRYNRCTTTPLSRRNGENPKWQVAEVHLEKSH